MYLHFSLLGGGTTDFRGEAVLAAGMERVGVIRNRHALVGLGDKIFPAARSPPE